MPQGPQEALARGLALQGVGAGGVGGHVDQQTWCQQRADLADDLAGEPCPLKVEHVVVQRLAVALEHQLPGTSVQLLEQQLRRVLRVYLPKGGRERVPGGVEVCFAGVIALAEPRLAVIDLPSVQREGPYPSGYLDTLPATGGGHLASEPFTSVTMYNG